MGPIDKRHGSLVGEEISDLPAVSLLPGLDDLEACFQVHFRGICWGRLQTFHWHSKVSSLFKALEELFLFF